MTKITFSSKEICMIRKMRKMQSTARIKVSFQENLLLVLGITLCHRALESASMIGYLLLWLVQANDIIFSEEMGRRLAIILFSYEMLTLVCSYTVCCVCGKILDVC